jgi:hypothetical protein
MLQLRTIYTNGDWESFQQFRVEAETERLYPHTTAVAAVDWPFAQAL